MGTGFVFEGMNMSWNWIVVIAAQQFEYTNNTIVFIR